MRREEFRHPKAESGRVVLTNNATRYASIVSAQEIGLSAHTSWDTAGELWLSSVNERGDYRPIRLTPEAARALRDGLDLFLEDHPSPLTQES